MCPLTLRSRHPVAGVRRRRLGRPLTGIVGILVLGAVDSGDAATAPPIEWVNTDPMATTRYEHTSTLLDAPICHQAGRPAGYPCGQLLVTGGRTDGPGPTGAAQIYDPATERWRSAGSMAIPRQRHTATLLTDGSVLVAGGYAVASGTALSSAEVYHPAASSALTGVTGTWAPAAPLLTGRWGHSATRLDGPACRASGSPEYCGKVLVAGGASGPSSPTDSAELYDPRRGTWSSAPPMHVSHQHHTATLLDGLPCHGSRVPAGYPCGQVLVTGGQGGSALYGVTDATELYDPDANGGAGSWTLLDSLQHARWDHTATLLPDGSVLVAGGVGTGKGTTDQIVLAGRAERLDPTPGSEADRWLSAGAMSTDRDAATATLLPDGRVTVAGGIGQSKLRSSDLYDPAPRAVVNGVVVWGAWSAGPALNQRRGFHAATLLPAGPPRLCGARCAAILATGGQTPAGITETSELLAPLGETPPTVAIDPRQGYTVGGTPVTITGSNLQSATTVTFAGAPPLSCGAGPPAPCWADPLTPGEKLHAVSPPHPAGPAHVTVSVYAAVGTEITSDATDADVFTYLPVPGIPPPPPPVVSAVAPACGPRAGGTEVTITGLRLVHATQVMFGDASGLVVAVSLDGAELTATSPSHGEGIVAVTVTTSTSTGPQSSTGSAASTYRFSDSCLAPITPPTLVGQRAVEQHLVARQSDDPFRVTPYQGGPHSGGIISPPGTPPGAAAPNGAAASIAAGAAPGGVPSSVGVAGVPRTREAGAATAEDHAMVGTVRPGLPAVAGGLGAVTLLSLVCCLVQRRAETRAGCRAAPRFAS